MTELRKDYILNRYVIIASARGKRPHEFKEAPMERHVEHCFFCPGNEDTTPMEIGHYGEPWEIRWFQNKFPAVDTDGQVKIKTDNEYYTYAGAIGHHEIIVETRDHNGELHLMSPKQLYNVFQVFSDRVDAITDKPTVKYALLFKNHGPKAGTSIVHSHSQIIAYNQVPAYVQEKVEATKTHTGCPYCQIISREKDSTRRCIENDSFISFTPYASRYPFEVWCFPKRHVRMMHELTGHEKMELAKMTKELLGRIAELNASYNIVFQHAPNGEDLHFHIEIKPRIGTWGGFELGTDTIINSMPPEEAAKFYRKES